MTRCQEFPDLVNKSKGVINNGTLDGLPERGITWYSLCTESCSMPPSSAAFEKAAIAGTFETRLSVGEVGRLKL